MVIVTTLVTPPALKWSLGRRRAAELLKREHLAQRRDGSMTVRGCPAAGEKSHSAATPRAARPQLTMPSSIA